MDPRDGSILDPAAVAALKAMAEDDEAARERLYRLKPMALPLTHRQRATGKVGRNEPCPCGSGKKFKKCCLEVR